MSIITCSSRGVGLELKGTGDGRNRGRNDDKRMLELKPNGRVIRTYESSFVAKGTRDCDQAVRTSRCGVCKCKAKMESCLNSKGQSRPTAENEHLLYMAMTATAKTVYPE